MNSFKIRQIFECSYDDYCASGHFRSDIRQKAAHAILNCKSGRLGVNLSQCTDCGHVEIHNNSCRNRNCPNCQAVLKEIWVDKRRAEVIDSPYFHVVFTLPHELNPLLYCNQKLLYGLLHRCCAETLLELSADKKWLGATPGIIQVLHTWNRELDYHVHMHCIVSGGGLTKDGKIRKSSKNFFIRTEVLRDKFKGKYMAHLASLYESGSLAFSSSCENLRNSYLWKEFKNNLYGKDWCPYIKETFNGFGNAIEYLGRYTHKIAISNNRILSVTDDTVTFSARGKKQGEPKRQITLTHTEFIRRYLMHVLPSGFFLQKFADYFLHYGLLCSRSKNQKLTLCRNLLGCKKYISKLRNMEMPQIMEYLYGIRICVCKACGGHLGKPQIRMPLRC